MNINGSIVQKISGPFHYKLLKPKRKYTHLPVIMLFGDYHIGNENTCSSSEKQSDGVYTIYDKEFFDVLTMLTPDEKKYPIDVYSEDWNRHWSSDKITNLPLVKFSKTIQNCTKFTKRRENISSCINDKIRFHYADTRYYDKFLEGKISGIIDILEKTFSKNKNIQVFDIFQLKETIHKFIGEDDVMNKFLSDIFLYFVDPVNLYKKYFKTINDDRCQSIVKKQLSKTDLPEFFNFSIWMKYLNKSTIHITNSLNLPDINLKAKLFSKFIVLLLDKNEKDYVKLEQLYNVFSDKIDSILTLYTMLCSPFLDIYTVLRILKQPTGGEKPVFVMGYFGYHHCKNIYNILSEFNIYTIEDEIGETRKFDNFEWERGYQPNRCIEFSPINISELINNTISYRKKYHTSIKKNCLYSSEQLLQELDDSPFIFLTENDGKTYCFSYTDIEKLKTEGVNFLSGNKLDRDFLNSL